MNDFKAATGEYVKVYGEMTIAWTVELPVELCHEPVCCDDPAVEAALQAVAGHISTYIWGEDKKPAVVYCDLNEQSVEIESDDRKHIIAGDAYKCQDCGSSFPKSFIENRKKREK